MTHIARHVTAYVTDGALRTVVCVYKERGHQHVNSGDPHFHAHSLCMLTLHHPLRGE